APSGRERGSVAPAVYVSTVVVPPLASGRPPARRSPQGRRPRLGSGDRRAGSQAGTMSTATDRVRPRSIHSELSVDVQRLASDVAGVVTGQEGDARRLLVHLALASHRDP